MTKITIPPVVSSQYTDDEIRKMADELFEYYERFGDRHYSDTSQDRMTEIYWDNVTERLINDIEIDMTDEEIEIFCSWLAEFY